MVRTHGWGGATPSSDEEAIDRILDVAEAEIELRGADIRIAEVARTLGISRQTVYNHFPGSGALLEAAAIRSGLRFLDPLAAHLAEFTDPVQALVEALAFTLEWLPENKPIQVMLVHDFTTASTRVTSQACVRFGHTLLTGLAVDWSQWGFGEGDLDDLVEYLLRILQSFMADPGHPPRRGTVLRDYLHRWVAPVLHAELGTHR